MAKDHANLIPAERIERRILLLRGQKVLLDFQLAELYEVPTKALNQAVKRNLERFPSDFMFQLSADETQFVMRSPIVTTNLDTATNSLAGSEILRSQIVTSKLRPGSGGRRYQPLAFTEQGVAMLSSVLRSPRAIQVNIAIMRTFVHMRRILASHDDLARKLEALEKKYDAKFRVVFDVIRELMTEKRTPRREIGFHTLMPKPAKPGGAAARKSKFVNRK